MNVDRTGLVKYIKEYVHGAGRKKVVVGVSGGMDSSVIACLAVEALGKENVIGISMPYGSQESVPALELCVNLDIPCAQLEITDAADKLHHQFTEQESASLLDERNPSTDLLLGNVMARIRMTTLYMYAEAHQALVIGTTNKTEAMIGYHTKGGDGMVDFEPLIEYWKTEVQALGHAFTTLINEKLDFIIPESIRTAAPSAGLWEGQTDEDELGVTYANLDGFLQRFEDPECSMTLGASCPEFLYDDGVVHYTSMAPDQAHGILNLMKATEHKRCMPPGYKRQ